MSKLRRFLIEVDTELYGTSKEYYAEDEENLEGNVNFLNICDQLAYDNYLNYSYNYSYEDQEKGYDTESDDYHEIELERYSCFVRELTEEEYEENKDYYNELERIW